MLLSKCRILILQLLRWLLKINILFLKCITLFMRSHVLFERPSIYDIIPGKCVIGSHILLLHYISSSKNNTKDELKIPR